MRTTGRPAARLQWRPASTCPARLPCGNLPTARLPAPRCSRPAARPRRSQQAPLSAALANGADTLSITADCYSVAAADAALAAALLAYTTPRRTPRRPAPSRLRCWPTITLAQVDALCWPPGPGRLTTTPALVAYRSAADQDTATASSIAATLLSVAQVDGLLAGKLGVTEAASALQIAALPGPHGRLSGKADVATHTAGAVSVDGYTLTLAVNPWNIQLDARPRACLRGACPRTTSTTPCTAALRVTRAPGAHFQRWACPTRQERWRSTASKFWTHP